uniref:c-SKI SMAD4-binding domain-containing protein n=1 Tax=Anopheles marajoara TaxID=58244 RepID=A0A2M4BRC6_9DIPT
MTEYIPPPHVMSVLKTYQDKAPKSLHGPGLSLVHPSKSSASSSSAVRSETPDHHHHHQGDGGSGGGGSGHNHSHHHSRSDDEQQHQQQPPQQSSSSLASSSSPAQRVTIVPAPMVLGPPVPAVPIMTTPDPDCGIVNMTVLEGKRIGCFLLGGEMRLCLPQIFNNILMDFTVEQINRSIQELMIYLYNCTDQQLQEFKRANIIPETAKTCGLITRTNAERLCSSLLHQPAATASAAGSTGPGTSQSLKGGTVAGSGSFRVYHRCFGKCEGILTPELYSYDEPACIECCECRGLYSPQKFVCHQHEPQEIRTCHWGFDSSQWRLYIHVIDSDKNRDEHTQILQKIWNKEREIEQELAEYERELWIARRKVFTFSNTSVPYVVIKEHTSHQVTPSS